MKIGIIGAENSHTAAIAKTLNVDKAIKGVEVSMVWGEMAEYAKKAAMEGKIPTRVKYSRDMLGEVDAVVVDHRHAKYHLKAVTPFVKAGIPTFVDKPFCFRSAEGIEFLRLAREHNVPVTSFGVIPEQKTYAQFVKKIEGLGTIASGATYGPCDLKSPWGGIFFYGIHQVEMVLRAFGYDVYKVLITRNGDNAIAQMIYASGTTVTMHLIKEGLHEFAITASGDNGVEHAKIVSDKNPYLTGIKEFVKMFKTGVEPLTPAEVLQPVLVLEALAHSLSTKQKVKVAAVPKDLRD